MLDENNYNYSEFISCSNSVKSIDTQIMLIVKLNNQHIIN